MIAVLVHYSGTVQGVGFRATAAHVARQFSVTGWVKNLPDGRVALWAQGEPQEVEGFLCALRDRMGEYIDQEQHQNQQGRSEHDSFRIVRD